MRHLSLLLLLSLLSSVGAAEPISVTERTITVHGRARQVVDADRFRIDAGITVVQARLDAARQGGDAMLDTLRRALAKAGLPAPTVAGRRLGRRSHWNPQTQEQVQEGFFATISLELTLDSREQLDAALAILVQSDAVEVGGVTFRVQREAELRTAVRRRALLAARDKAADMATTLGATLGEVRSIGETVPSWDQPAYANNSAVVIRQATTGDEPRAAEGTVEVVADVEVGFALR